MMLQWRGLLVCLRLSKRPFTVFSLGLSPDTSAQRNGLVSEGKQGLLKGKGTEVKPRMWHSHKYLELKELL